MKAIETTATVNEQGQLTLDQSLDIATPQRVRVIVLITEDEDVAGQAYPDLTDDQKRELDYRIDDCEAHPDNTLTWDQVKVSIKKQ